MKNNNKIRVLVTGMSPNLGGIETYLFKIAQNINRERFELVFLVSEGKRACYYNELNQLGCKILTIPSRKSNYYLYINNLLKIISKNNYDTVFCNYNSLSNPEVSIISRIKRINTIIVSHNANSISSIKTNILNSIGRQIVKFLDIRRISVSRIAGEWMFGSKSSFKVINNGIDVERFAFSKVIREKYRGVLGLRNNEVFISVSAFRPQKNHLRMIEIFNEYLKYNSDAILLLVGEGPLVDSVKAKAIEIGVDQRIRFLGIRNDISELLSMSDIFILTSFYEGFPISLVEAQASGLKCFVSDIITKEACFSPLCQQISLNSDNQEWAKIIANNQTNFNRHLGVDIVRQNGLDLDEDIKTIETMLTF